MQSQNIKDAKQKIQSKLFNAVYLLPVQKQPIQNYVQLQQKIKAISAQLNYLAKTNIEQIERVCKTNSKLHVVARLLRDHNPPANFKQANFSMIISAIINMFTLMMTSTKMIEFFNKLSIPFSVYRIVAHLRYICGSNRQEFLKKKQIQQSFKFIWKMLNVKSKNFPRLYAFLVTNVLTQFTYDSVQQIDKKQQQQGLVANKQNQRMSDTIKAILSIGIDLIKNNLKLAAQTGILVIMYKMATQNNLSLTVTTQVIDSIANHMKTQDNRDIILSSLDLCRVFALFTNVDLRLEESNKLERLQKCCIIIEMLLSHSSTLFYFIHQRLTLQNFVISLKSKNKGQKQKSVINEKIFKKLIDKVLRYDQNKMLRSHNYFGRQSNYLNYCALLILSFFLTSTDLFDIYLNSDPNGELFSGLGKVSLMYFPITFEKPKYNKQIIQTIKIPSVSDYEHLNKDFLNIISYYDECIVPYQFSKDEVLSFLLYIKQLEEYKQIEQEKKAPIQKLLQETKIKSTNFDQLLINFYREVMKICEILPWKPEYLKLSKFLSLSIDYLLKRRASDIKKQCLNVVKRIFTQAKPNYYRYLYVTALDDVGKYFQDDQDVKNLILSHYKTHDYSFRISRILLHIDINYIKKDDTDTLPSYKEILRNICAGGCEQLVLLVIEIIKVYCGDYDDKVKQVADIIEKCVYSQSQEVACAAVQFWEEFDAKHHHSQTYVKNFKLGDIKDNNLRKRIMFLMLNNQKGIQTLNNFNPNFIKQQIDLWLKQGNNHIRQFSSFLSKQSKKFTTNKDPPFLDIGKISQNRRKLIYLPWNIQINQKRYVAIATYKFQEERIKLRVTAELLIVDTKIQITFFDIGGLNFSLNTLNWKKQQIIKNYYKNRVKDTKEIKKFAMVKENITLFFKYQTGDKNGLVLRKLIVDIPLARDVYRSLTYPLNFITLLTKTGKGRASLRQHKFAEKCINYCKIVWEKQQRQIKQTDIQVIKGSIQCLGLLFTCRKLLTQQKKQICKTLFQVFQRTSNFQIKQVALWVLNIIVKDEELRKQWKNSKGWLLMQSKYCGWLCFPLFYNQSEFSDRPLNRFAHIYQLLDKSNKQGCPLTNAYLQLTQKKQKPVQQGMESKDDRQKSPWLLKRKVIQFFKRQQNKQHLFNPKLLDKVVTYLSTVNFTVQKTWQMLDLFTEYFLSEKFDVDLAYGSSMP